MVPRIADIDSRTFERTLSSNPLVVLPVGALEAHGPHLPLGADQIQAEATAESLAARLSAWVAPTLPYGCCPTARRFPGTVSLSLEGLAEPTRQVLAELARMGVRRILVLSGHADPGHMAALREAAASVLAEHPTLRVAVLSDYDFVYELRGRLSPPGDGHGGLLETSRVMALAPDRVGEQRPNVPSRGSPFVPGSPSPDAWPESVVGDTRLASAELGRQVQAHVLDRLEATVRDLLPA